MHIMPSTLPCASWTGHTRQVCIFRLAYCDGAERSFLRLKRLSILLQQVLDQLVRQRVPLEGDAVLALIGGGGRNSVSLSNGHTTSCRFSALQWQSCYLLLIILYCGFCLFTTCRSHGHVDALVVGMATLPRMGRVQLQPCRTQQTTTPKTRPIIIRLFISINNEGQI